MQIFFFFFTSFGTLPPPLASTPTHVKNAAVVTFLPRDNRLGLRFFLDPTCWHHWVYTGSIVLVSINRLRRRRGRRRERPSYATDAGRAHRDRARWSYRRLFVSTPVYGNVLRLYTHYGNALANRRNRNRIRSVRLSARDPRTNRREQ